MAARLENGKAVPVSSVSLKLEESSFTGLVAGIAHRHFNFE